MFIAYDVSLQLIRSLRPLVPVLKKHDRDLADQLRRAATSVALNLGEGRRRAGGDQRRHYEIAHGSAGEVLTALDVARAWGYVVDDVDAKQHLDRLLRTHWIKGGNTYRAETAIPVVRDAQPMPARAVARCQTT